MSWSTASKLLDLVDPFTVPACGYCELERLESSKTARERIDSGLRMRSELAGPGELTR